MNLERKMLALGNPDIYPSRPDEVEMLQTHASAVFLAGDLVYKLKKPVDFGFLNYSTLEQREQLCQAEVTLNRRLSRCVYMGVSRLTSSSGKIEIDGHGETVDYLVRMKRLSDDNSLRSRIRQGNITAVEVKAIARKIAVFHKHAARNVEIDRFGLPEAIAQNVLENFQQTHRYIGTAISQEQYDEIKTYAEEFLQANHDTFLNRIKSGHICDGHGGMRTDHVYLNCDVDIIDCIEFSDRLRYGDVAADIGFLLMDLDAMNRPDLARLLGSEYLDHEGNDLEPVDYFYRCYRAYVRGKVAALEISGDELDAEQRRQAQLDARRFFHLAHRYTGGAIGARLIIMYGLTGTGKSTLTATLNQALPATSISSDVVRKLLAGESPDSRHIVAPRAGIYSPEMTDRVYDKLLEDARMYLERGQTVILDASWLSGRHRQAAYDLAASNNSQFLVIECVAPRAVVKERLARRDSDSVRVSDGRWEIYLSQLLIAEPPTEFQPGEHVVVDMTLPPISQLDTIIGWL